MSMVDGASTQHSVAAEAVPLLQHSRLTTTVQERPGPPDSHSALRFRLPLKAQGASQWPRA